MSEYTKQFVHCTYFEKDNNNYIVINEKDRKTNTSRLVCRKNIQRPFWITKPEFRNHSYKKEYEDVNKLEMYYALEHDKYNVAFEKLNGYKSFKSQNRGTLKSPYIYGLDIEASVLIKTGYYEKNDIHPTISYGALDIETSMLGGGEVIVFTYVHEDYKVYTSIYRPFLKKPDGSGEFTLDDIKENCKSKLTEYINLYNTNNRNTKDHKVLTYDDLKIEYHIADKEIDVIRWVFSKIHECKPDICGVWNIDFDIPTLMDRLFKIVVRYYLPDLNPITMETLKTQDGKVIKQVLDGYKKLLESIFCHPEVPDEFKYVNYKKDNSFRDHITLYWHNLFVSGYTRYVDAMCLYSRKRTVQGRDVMYTLQYVAEKEVNIGKLELDGSGYHQHLQQHSFLDYIAYNQCDNLPLLFMEKKNKDFMTLIGTSDNSLIEHYASQSIGLTNSFYKFAKERGCIVGSASGSMKTEFCDSIPSTGGLVFDPTLTRDTAVPIIKNHDVAYGFHKYVFDLDLTSIYPSLIEVCNISKETKLSTCLNIEGNTKYLNTCKEAIEALDENDSDYNKKKLSLIGSVVENLFINLFNVQQNCVQIGEDYFGSDNYTDMLEKYKKYKETQS